MSIRVALAALWAAGLAAPLARADLYSATSAVEKQDFPRAFELYRELAELGRLEAQENLAVSYVNGEGVKRDNALGLGWALIARENGGSAEMQRLIDQLEPHLTSDAAKQRIADLRAQFGKDALQKNVLPVVRESKSLPSETGCKFLKSTNPDTYYPQDAIHRGISGSVYLDFLITPDGRAHHPRVLYAIPAGAFDEAAQAAIRDSTFVPKTENGVAVPCTIRVRIKFTVHSSKQSQQPNADSDDKVAATRTSADGGDPGSQLLYGLILDSRPEVNTRKEKACLWFLKAAQAGVPVAQFLVGIDTLTGMGFEPDSSKGSAWLTRAATAGQPNAQLALANYLMTPDGGADAASAQSWLEKASASGNLDARFHLAGLLATGPDAAHRDPHRALELLHEAMARVDTDPTAYEIRAAANAGLGQFEDAQKDQKRAIAMGKKLGWDLAPQQARLEKYEQRTAWTGDLFEAWPNKNVEAK